MTKRNIILPSVVTLIPTIFGILIWKDLPNIIAVHFNLNGDPNEFAGKFTVVFAMPVLLLIISLLCSL